MPYIITPCPRGCRAEDMEHRTAVATLDDARQASWQIVEDQSLSSGPSYGSEDEAMATFRAAHKMSEHGGTIGPLPDGYVIDVQCVTWTELAALAEPDAPSAQYSQAVTNDEILTTFNARSQPARGA